MRTRWLWARRAWSLLAASLLGAACYDFVEPDFPEAGAPAVLQATALMDENGFFNFNALLAPGLAIGGVQRRVENDTLDVYGLKLTPITVRRNGSRDYAFTDVLSISDPETLPFVLQGPVVEDVTGPPPHVRWLAVRKTDPDTISWMRGSELVLHLEMVVGSSQPPPAIQQWFMEIRGSMHSFRLSADGLPPLTLRIPSEWVPESDGDSVTVTFSFNQAGQQQSPGKDYIGNISFTVQLHWIVRVTQA